MNTIGTTIQSFEIKQTDCKKVDQELWDTENDILTESTIIFMIDRYLHLELSNT